MTVHSFSKKYKTEQYSSDNLPSYLQTNIKWSLKTNFTGLSKYGIPVLHSNILTFKLVLNSIERKERQKIQTNKGKHEIQKGHKPISISQQVQAPGLFFQWQGIGPAGTWHSAATAI